jgi:hypothetical protein
LWASFALVETLSIVLSFEDDLYQCNSLLSEKAEKIYTIFKWIMAFVLPYTFIVIVSVLLLKFLKEWSDKGMQMGMQNIQPLETANPQSNRTVVGSSSKYKSRALNKISKKQESSLLIPLLNVKEASEPQPLSAVSNCEPKRLTRKSTKNLHIKIKGRSTRFVLLVVF